MLLCLAYCAVSYVKLNVADLLPSITDSPCDFSHYYLVAQRVLAAQSPYTDPEHNYPPAVAFLLTPLALTDYMTARWLWFWSSQVLLLLGAFLTWRALGRDWVSALGSLRLGDGWRGRGELRPRTIGTAAGAFAGSGVLARRGDAGRGSGGRPLSQVASRHPRNCAASAP